MLRILLIIILFYLIFRIALRLYLGESPSRRRQRIYRQNMQAGETGASASARDFFRFDEAEDAEFEELPSDEPGKPGSRSG